MSTRRTVATILRRYTDLSSALDVLKNRRLTLLSPTNWEDRTDRASMDAFVQGSGSGTILALCFSQAAETFHHWKTFSCHSSGVCIEFRKKELLACIPRDQFKHKRVKYQKPTAFLSDYPGPHDLPFIKSWPYRHEMEYRIIHTSEQRGLLSKHISIPLSAVRTIVLSPWMPRPLVDGVRETLNAIAGCENIGVLHSHVIENEAWVKYVRMGA